MISNILTIALIAVGFTAVLRALAPLSLKVRKPISCDLCMSWWGSWAGAVLRFLHWPPEIGIVDLFAIVFASTGLAFIVHRVLMRLDMPAFREDELQ